MAILTSKHRKQLRQQQATGVACLENVYLTEKEKDGDRVAASIAAGKHVALGSTKGRPWADVGWLRALKKKARDKAREQRQETPE